MLLTAMIVVIQSIVYIQETEYGCFEERSFNCVVGSTRESQRKTDEEGITRCEKYMVVVCIRLLYMVKFGCTSITIGIQW